MKRRNFIASIFGAVVAVPLVKLLGPGDAASFGHYYRKSWDDLLREQAQGQDLWSKLSEPYDIMHSCLPQVKKWKWEQSDKRARELICSGESVPTIMVDGEEHYDLSGFYETA